MSEGEAFGSGFGCASIIIIVALVLFFWIQPYTPLYKFDATVAQLLPEICKPGDRVEIQARYPAECVCRDDEALRCAWMYATPSGFERIRRYPGQQEGPQ